MRVAQSIPGGTFQPAAVFRESRAETPIAFNAPESVTLSTPSNLEQPIGDPRAAYIDPEFSPVSGTTVYQDGDDNIWMAQVDPETGQMIPADGQGQLLGQTVSIKSTLQGPEYGQSQQGETVVWTGTDENGYIHLHIPGRRDHPARQPDRQPAAHHDGPENVLVLSEILRYDQDSHAPTSSG